MRRARCWSPGLVLSIGLALGVFLADVFLPLGVVVGIPYEQLLGNLSRKGFVPIRGSAHEMTEDGCIFVVLYSGDPLHAHPQTPLSC